MLAALVPLSGSAQELAGDGGIDLEALLRRVGALEKEVTRLKTPGPAPTSSPPQQLPLDVSEPPFSLSDWTWLNGSNYQPSSLLRIGPVTPTFFVDADYAWQFSNPVDHTIFPTTTAARHSEFSFSGRRLRGDGRLQAEPLAAPARRIHSPRCQPALLLGPRWDHRPQRVTGCG